MSRLFLLLLLSLLYSCSSKTSSSQGDAVMSMQIVDRNGFTETISNKERIASFDRTDFLTPQPFQKVLRVYGKSGAGQTLSKITSYHENGQLWQYLEAVDGRAHGIYREWFPNGVQKVEACLAEGVADIHDLAQATWVFQGNCTVWNEQAAKVAEFYYEKGLLDTPARYYFADGALQKIIPYSQGDIEGVVQAFDQEGHVIEEVPYRGGEKQGKATAYWSKECLRATELFDQGRLIEASYFNPSGLLVAEVKDSRGKQAEFNGEILSALFSVENGVIEGKVEQFSPIGTLHSSYILKDGKKEGEEWEYYPSEKAEEPKAKLCVHWNDDKIQGQVRTWYPNGKIESQREIHANKKQGVSLAWYKNGDLMLHEQYENELLVKGSYYKPGDKQAVSKVDAGKGLATLYTSDGIFLKKVSYEKGKPIPNHSSVR
jgi:antitoxin component YwqK of YwqJK toxin-antitoxin module